MERMSDPGVVDSRLHPCLSAGDSRWEDVLEEAVSQRPVYQPLTAKREISRPVTLFLHFWTVCHRAPVNVLSF